jgi:hypothetical protein
MAAKSWSSNSPINIVPARSKRHNRNAGAPLK